MFDFLKKKVSKEIITAPIKGRLLANKDIPDETFKQELLGKCVAIEPVEGKVYSPVDGNLSFVADTKHAVSITSSEGCEILIHVGMDTVTMKGEPFTLVAKQGEDIKKGDLIMEFDMDKIKEAGFPLVSPVVICNTDDYKEVVCYKDKEVNVGDSIIEVIK